MVLIEKKFLEFWYPGCKQRAEFIKTYISTVSLCLKLAVNTVL